MNASFVQLLPERLERLVRDPSGLPRMLARGSACGEVAYSAGLDGWLASLPAAQRRMIDALPRPAHERYIAQMTRMMGAPVSPRSATTPDGDGVLSRLDLYQEWHAVHFLLAGTGEPVDEPPGNAILGGCEIGDDLGYGPARYLTAVQVREIAALLARFPEGQLRSRLDPTAFVAADLYPNDGWHDVGVLYEVREAFERVRRFYLDSAEFGNAILTFLK